MIGFQEQKNILSNLGDKIAPASFLFSGIDMIGKKTFAVEWARELNDYHGVDTDMLLVALLPEQNSISIEQIRDTADFLSRKPLHGRYTIAIINDAHLMTGEAQNALLKVLEEPSPTSIIILIAHQPFLLLDTIRSRCQTIEFQPHARDVVFSLLDKHTMSQEQKNFLASLVAGRTGLLLDMLKDDSYNDMRGILTEFQKIKTGSIAERLKLTRGWIGDEASPAFTRTLLFSLLYYYQHRKIKGTDVVLRNLLNLYRIQGQSRYNRKLAGDAFAASF